MAIIKYRASVDVNDWQSGDKEEVASRWLYEEITSMETTSKSLTREEALERI